MCAVARRMPVVLVAAALVGSAQAASAQSCPGGREPHVGLGVGLFHCQGGTCITGGAMVTMEREEERRPRPPKPERGMLYDFSIEPRLWQIDEDGPAADRLQDGDVLVAVNGLPITTRDGGRQLSAMRPGQPVTLTVRRDGRVIPTTVTPEATCTPPSLSAGPDPRPSNLDLLLDDVVDDVAGGRAWAGPETERTAAGTTALRYLGAELLAATVVDVGIDRDVRWWFAEPPVVLHVGPGTIAERAGIRPGAVLLEVEGRSVATPEGTAALARFGPGQTLRLRLRHGGEETVVLLEGRR